MPTATIQAPADDFISLAESQRQHPGLSANVVYRLAAAQQVRVMLVPGVAPRYSRLDLQRALQSRGA